MSECLFHRYMKITIIHCKQKNSPIHKSFGSNILKLFINNTFIIYKDGSIFCGYPHNVYNLWLFICNKLSMWIWWSMPLNVGNKCIFESLNIMGDKKWGNFYCIIGISYIIHSIYMILSILFCYYKHKYCTICYEVLESFKFNVWNPSKLMLYPIIFLFLKT